MKINKEGYRIITTTLLLFAALATICFIWTPCVVAIIVSALLLGLFGFIVYFFRQPSRPYLSDENIVFSPADGKIVVIEKVQETEYLNEKRLQISVFMSVTNVHINWYPVSGTVEYFKYHPGKFLVAWHPKSSELNERTTTVVNMGTEKILFRQIAGYVARRIVSYPKVGDKAQQNTKFGFIKFGSRIDLFLPPDAQVLVRPGQKVTGSQTPLARLK